MGVFTIEGGLKGRGELCGQRASGFGGASWQCDWLQWGGKRTTNPVKMTK